MKLDDFIKAVQANSDFKILEKPQCPVPPYCDGSECPPHTCEKKVLIERCSPRGLYFVSCTCPSKEIDDNCMSLKNIIKAGVSIPKNNS